MPLILKKGQSWLLLLHKFEKVPRFFELMKPLNWYVAVFDSLYRVLVCEKRVARLNVALNVTGGFRTAPFQRAGYARLRFPTIVPSLDHIVGLFNMTPGKMLL